MRRDRPLHLLEVGLRWPPETFVGWKLEGLAARGMRVTVASKSVYDPHARLRGVELVELPPPGTTAKALRIVARACLVLLATSPRRLLRLARGIRRYPAAEYHPGYPHGLQRLAAYLPLARLRPDLVVFEWHGAAVFHQPLVDVWDCPVVTSCRGSDISVYPHMPDQEEYARLLPHALRRASAVHCVSESLKLEAIQFGLDPSKARVIRSAVDPQLFRPAPSEDRPTGTLRVVTVGWLRWEKGHEYALEAVRALLDRGVPVRLRMAGGVPAVRSNLGERERVLHTIADLGLEGHVRLEGHLASQDVCRVLQESDVLLHASVTEGIPNAVVEAMACAVPVVATRCGGIPEIVGDGVEGLLVEPREPEQIVDALTRLWRDPALRKRIGDAGRARVLPELTVDHEHDAFAALYREVVARGRRREAPEFVVQTDGRRPTGLPSGALRLVSIAPLTWEQGLEHSVHAVRLLLDMGVPCRYRIVGDGDHLLPLAFARHQLELTEHVEFLRDGQPDELSRSDVFVDPAVTDTSRADLESARARGIPAVVTRRPGLPGEGVLVVPRRSPTAIADAVATIARRAPRRSRGSPAAAG